MVSLFELLLTRCRVINIPAAESIIVRVASEHGGNYGSQQGFGPADLQHRSALGS